MLRFSKGKGFKEIVYRGVKDTTYSKFFLLRVRACLLNFDDQTTNDFMNSVFNSLNDVTAELFIVFKEIKDSPLNSHVQVLRRIKYFIDLIIDLSRILELLTRWVPELFLSKNMIHASRLLDFVLFIFRSIFRMSLDSLFVDFCNKLTSRSRTLPQFLVPLIGILTNLYSAISVLSSSSAEDVQRRAISESLSDDLSKLNEILSTVTISTGQEEEKTEDDVMHVETFEAIQA